MILEENNFVALFCSLLRLKYDENNKRRHNIINNCYFNYLELCDFIFKMKSDFRFYELLKEIDIIINYGVFYSINLITSINRAKSRYLITAVDGDNYYVSRAYDKTTILRDNAEWIPIMGEFIKEYLSYIEIQDMKEDYGCSTGVNMRDVYDLKLRFREEKWRED